MAQDITGQFYSCFNLPLQEKLRELTRIIDQSIPNKELQSLFPQLISNIFTSSFNNGWGLRTTTYDHNRFEFELLTSFLEPHGPMFQLCYKLLSDPQLKYHIPLDILPKELQLTLERGRCPQFYADMINMDSQAMHVVALAMNPFDYYMFHFALHLVNNNPNKSYWENWNSVYFALACDYLTHFLPIDPNVTVQPQISHYAGKVPMAAPLQTANRPLCSPSSLFVSDISGMNNQHVPSQTQARNEVWRSETVLQVFVDVWMSVEEINGNSMQLYQINESETSSPERVRTARVLVKHIHTYSAKHATDPASRTSALRKYARQIMCARAYHYIKYLVTTWPLDASFRLVLELWLSLIQPWRYTNRSINKDGRFQNTNNNRDEGNAPVVDGSQTQFIAENFPSYTCIFQLILPRFSRLDLTAYKNAVMLFRLGKVFSQPHLVSILRDLEQAITEHGTNGLYYNADTSWNYSSFNHSNSYNGVPSNRWASVAKQAISELNLSTSFQYEPIWGEGRKPYAMEFVQRIAAAKAQAERNLDELQNKLALENQGIWANIKSWLMITSNEDEISLEECKKVPTYLGAAVHHMSHIFGFSESSIVPSEADNITESMFEQSSTFANSSKFQQSITNKLRHTPTDIKYMGDPDRMPITSYESTILVRMLYQVASRLNELYQQEFSSLWSRTDFRGYVAREILQPPCTVHSYVKDHTYHQQIVAQNLPARLSLRKLGSHACVFWLTIGYLVFRMFSYSAVLYLLFLATIWIIFVFCKAGVNMLRAMHS